MSIRSDDSPVDPNEVEGFAAVPNWMVRDRRIGRNVLLVYLVLSSHAGSKEVCYPSQRLIAEECGLSVSTVKRTIYEMVNRGVLDVEVTRTKTGRKNTYRLLIHAFSGKGMGSP